MALVRKQDLRTGRPVWDDACALPSSPIASRRCDVVVVGAGVTGALVAETTSALGLDTVIVDRRRPAAGSTAASTALIQFEIDMPLSKLAESIGFDAAARAWRRSYKAVDDLASLVQLHGIACGHRRTKAIYLAGNTLSPTDLGHEAAVRQTAGLPSQFVKRADLLLATGLSADAALMSTGAADLNPVALTQALLALAISRGALLHFPVEATDVICAGGRVVLGLKSGHELEARHIIFATGYELVDGVPCKGHRLTSTWAYATRPQPEALRIVSEAVLWEAAEPYLYVRSTVDGRLLVGGEDEGFSDEPTRDAAIAEKIARLEQKAGRLFPWLDATAETAWAGTFGESDNGLPSIGPVPGMPGCYAVLGFGGNGITFGVLAAELLRAHLTGVRDPDACLFEFSA